MENKYYFDEINKTVWLSFDFDKNIVEDIKKCGFGTRWNSDVKMWAVPISDFSRNKVKHVIRQYGFKRSYFEKEEDIKVSYKRNKEDLKELRKLCDSKDFLYKPFDYQLDCLGYCLDKGNVINGDDVGLGKTLESITYAEAANSFPCLIITPSAVKPQWQKEYLKITKNRRSVSYIMSKETKTHRNDWSADVVVINYDIVSERGSKTPKVKFKQLLDIDWKMVIFDEAHYLKNAKSARSKICKKIAHKNKGTIIQALTGTASTAKPIDLWNLLVIIGKEKSIANSWESFVRKYCNAYKIGHRWVLTGASNIIELNKKLRDNCYIQRSKREVRDDMPDVIRQVVNMEITNKSKIDKASEDIVNFILETKGEEASEKAQNAEHLVALNTLKKLSIEGKIKAIDNYLKDIKELNKKTVIFGISREPLKKLSDKFKSPIIQGGTSSVKKAEIVSNWIEGDDLFLFANMESCGTGVDGLQKVCSNMIILEIPDLPKDLTQVIGRLDRTGQTESVTVTFALSDETIDKTMFENIVNKEFVAEAINTGLDVKRNGKGLNDLMKNFINSKK
jgi:SWI/SNF-related matrix-associated actin-dependent regulator 1 of chromatin subfamily A